MVTYWWRQHVWLKRTCFTYNYTVQNFPMRIHEYKVRIRRIARTYHIRTIYVLYRTRNYIADHWIFEIGALIIQLAITVIFWKPNAKISIAGLYCSVHNCRVTIFNVGKTGINLFFYNLQLNILQTYNFGNMKYLRSIRLKLFVQI